MNMLKLVKNLWRYTTAVPPRHLAVGVPLRTVPSIAVRFTKGNISVYNGNNARSLSTGKSPKQQHESYLHLDGDEGKPARDELQAAKPWKGLSLDLSYSPLTGPGDETLDDVNCKLSTEQMASIVPPTNQSLPSNNLKGIFPAGINGHGLFDVIGTQRLCYNSPQWPCYVSVRNYKIADKLPTWVPEPDKAGLTYTVQFSPEDMHAVSVLALEELKTFLDEKKVRYKESQSQTAKQDNGVLKSDIEVLVEKDLKAGRISSSLKVPAVVKMMLRYLNEIGTRTDGILSKQDNETKYQELLKDIETKFYSDPKYKIPPGFSIHDVAAALKQFLRQLPVPLVTSHQFERYPVMSSLPTCEKHLKGMNLFIMTMKAEYRDTLMMVLIMLHNIAANMFSTRVDERALSIIFAPCFFRFDEGDKVDAEYYTHVTRIMIHFNELLFIISASMQCHLRGMTHKSERSFVRKISLSHLSPCVKRKETEHDIMVYAPGNTKQSDIVTIDPKVVVSAHDVISSYSDGYMEMDDFWMDLKTRLNYLDPQMEDKPLYLFEVGGNIVERCLLPRTNMMNLNKINPDAIYFIKSSMGSS